MSEVDKTPTQPSSKKRSMIDIMALSETVRRVAREQKLYRTETIHELSEAADVLAELADGMKESSDETSERQTYTSLNYVGDGSLPNCDACGKPSGEHSGGTVMYCPQNGPAQEGVK